jgi:hypothetical protein
VSATRYRGEPLRNRTPTPDRRPHIGGGSFSSHLRLDRHWPLAAEENFSFVAIAAKTMGRMLCGNLSNSRRHVHASISTQAQKPAWQPRSGTSTFKIWPAAAPGAPDKANPEADTTTAKDNLIAGKPLIRLGFVSSPILTIYKPKGKNTGAAVVVFPGGGYKISAIDLEGTEVCDWLSAKCINLRAAQVPRPRHRSIPQVFSRPSRRPASRRPLPLPRCRMVVRRCRRC